MALVFEPRRRRAAQERAIAGVEKLDGLVGARPGSCLVEPTRRPVLAISLNNPDVTDADLVPLAWLTELETPDLSRTKVTDAGLAHLGGHRRRASPSWGAYQPPGTAPRGHSGHGCRPGPFAWHGC